MRAREVLFDNKEKDAKYNRAVMIKLFDIYDENGLIEVLGKNFNEVEKKLFVMQCISAYTIQKVNTLGEKVIEFLKNAQSNGFIKAFKVKQNDKGSVWLEITLDNGKVLKAYKASEEYFKEIKDLLESPKRLGACHNFAVQIGGQMVDCDIVTGYIYAFDKYLEDKTEYSSEFGLQHSFITFKTPKQDYAVDLTNNLIMAKNDFYDMLFFDEVNVIKSEDIKNNFSKIEKFYKDFLTGINGGKRRVYLDEVLMFFYELLEDINKNENIIKSN